MNHTAALAQLARFVLRPAQWDAQADAWARRIPCDSPGSLFSRLVAQVESGEAKVCDALVDGRRAGFIVFTATPEHELLIVAAFGRDRRENLMDAFLPEFDKLARACECRVVRFHTMRPAAVCRAQKLGYRVSEIIMRKDVS